MIRLIMVRHGETTENNTGILQGHMQSRLSDRGLSQAEKLSERLKGEKIDIIYSSDLYRAADTAKLIKKYHPDIPLKFTTDLRERDHGEFQGRKKVDCKDYINGLVQPNQGESMDDLMNRAKKFFDYILSNHEDETILLVGHNRINSALVSTITAVPSDDIPHQINCAVSIFELNKNGDHQFILDSCDRHL